MILSEWFQSISQFEKYFWYIAIPATVVFLFQLFFTFFGGDVDDVDSDIDGGIEFQFLTVKNFINFLTIFSWSGIALYRSGLSELITVLFALIAGLLMMFAMAYLAYSMSKLAEDGTWNIRNSIYKSATVYLTIPPSMNGKGKVQLDVQGLKTLDAMTNDETELKTGSVVTVVDVESEILIVTSIKS